MVKVWSGGGDQLGVVRAHTSFLSQRVGPLSCLAFAPHDLLLASGGGDAIAAIYTIEVAQAAGAAPPHAPERGRQ